MSDITVCDGGECPLKNNCYRFLAERNPLWQSYFTEIPYNKETNTCSEFDKVNKKTNKMEKVKITKLTDDKFENNHPNNINEGFIKKGNLITPPVVGYSCMVDSFYTSTVQEIVSKTDKEIIFKTLNSTYKLEILD